MSSAKKTRISSSFKLFFLISVLFTSLSCYAFGSRDELFVHALADTQLSDKAKLAEYKKAIKSKNPYIAEKAAIESLFINPTGDVYSRAKALSKDFQSSVPLISRIIEVYLEKGDISGAKSLLNSKFQDTLSLDDRIRIQALQVRLLIAEKKDFSESLIDLFTMAPIGKEHLYFNTSSFLDSLPKDLEALLRLRFAIYTLDYTRAYRYAENFIVEIQTSGRKPLLYTRQILSDIGKAYLYGSTAYETNASFFETLARTQAQSTQKTSGDEVAFIAYFYAARISERLGSSFNEQVLSLYELSFKNASSEDYDNALWYYLNLLEKISLSHVIDAIEKTIDNWHNASYFSDILERLSYRLLSERKWNTYYALYQIIEDRADSESQARFAYISARLIQEGLLILPSELPKQLSGAFAEAKEVEQRIKNLFSKAFYDNHSSLYYRILAADKLNIPIEDSTKYLNKKDLNEDEQSNKALEEALLLYAKYGLFDLVYEEYFSHAKEISIEIAVKLAKYFAESGNEDSRLYPMSIRLAIRSSNSRNEALSKNILEAMYPQFFTKEIEENGNEFSLEKYLIFALVRSESLFEKDVVSHAGAIGLAQLMKPTAGDIAQKLRISEYDLLDAQTNIRFGSFYLAELLGRLDNSPMLALASYNAGISRVRSWVQNTELQADLFLETIPFEETREYGKKILSAAAMYGYLYYGKSSHEIVAALMK